jgi:aromatic ring-cleaving dioxygenase
MATEKLNAGILKMVLWQLSNVISGLVVWILLLERGLTFMVHPTQNKELKEGGNF